MANRLRTMNLAKIANALNKNQGDLEHVIVKSTLCTPNTPEGYFLSISLYGQPFSR